MHNAVHDIDLSKVYSITTKISIYVFAILRITTNNNNIMVVNIVQIHKITYYIRHFTQILSSFLFMYNDLVIDIDIGQHFRIGVIFTTDACKILYHILYIHNICITYSCSVLERTIALSWGSFICKYYGYIYIYIKSIYKEPVMFVFIESSNSIIKKHCINDVDVDADSITRKCDCSFAAFCLFCIVLLPKIKRYNNLNLGTSGRRNGWEDE